MYVTKVYIKKADYFISEDDYKVLKANVPQNALEEIKMLKAMSEKYPNGIEELSIISKDFRDFLIAKRKYVLEMFKKSKDYVFTVGGEK